MLVDINKKYKTKSGKDILIYMVHEHGYFPVHGAVHYDDGLWEPESWTINGYYNYEENLRQSPLSLEEVK